MADPAPSERGRTHRALLLGNSRLGSGSERFAPLATPPGDVAALRAALTDTERGVHSKRHVQVVLDAPKERMLAALEAFFHSAGPDDQLLLFYSGHGIVDERGALHLCASDTMAQFPVSTAVPAEVIVRLADLSPAAAVVIVLDCRYGSVWPGPAAAALAAPQRLVVASPPSAPPADDGRVSTFTAAVAAGLVAGPAADRDRDGRISFGELCAFVAARLAQAGLPPPESWLAPTGADLAVALAMPDLPSGPWRSDPPPEPSWLWSSEEPVPAPPASRAIGPPRAEPAPRPPREPDPAPRAAAGPAAPWPPAPGAPPPAAGPPPWQQAPPAPAGVEPPPWHQSPPAPAGAPAAPLPWEQAPATPAGVEPPPWQQAPPAPTNSHADLASPPWQQAPPAGPPAATGGATAAPEAGWPMPPGPAALPRPAIGPRSAPPDARPDPADPFSGPNDDDDPWSPPPARPADRPDTGPQDAAGWGAPDPSAPLHRAVPSEILQPEPAGPGPAADRPRPASGLAGAGIAGPDRLAAPAPPGGGRGRSGRASVSPSDIQRPGAQPSGSGGPVTNLPPAATYPPEAGDALLGEITFRLSQLGERVIALVGQGAVGPASPAVRYASQHAQEYRVCWWLRAHDPVLLSEDWRSLAAEVGLPANADLLRAVPELRNWLEDERHGPWLLVLDGAPAPEEVAPYVPKGGRGRVLVTATTSGWEQLASSTPMRMDGSGVRHPGNGIGPAAHPPLAPAGGTLPGQPALGHGHAGAPPPAPRFAPPNGAGIPPGPPPVPFPPPPRQPVTPPPATGPPPGWTPAPDRSPAGPAHWPADDPVVGTPPPGPGSRGGPRPTEGPRLGGSPPPVPPAASLPNEPPLGQLPRRVPGQHEPTQPGIDEPIFDELARQSPMHPNTTGSQPLSQPPIPSAPILDEPIGPEPARPATAHAPAGDREPGEEALSSSWPPQRRAPAPGPAPPRPAASGAPPGPAPTGPFHPAPPPGPAPPGPWPPGPAPSGPPPPGPAPSGPFVPGLPPPPAQVPTAPPPGPPPPGPPPPGSTASRPVHPGPAPAGAAPPAWAPPGPAPTPGPVPTGPASTAQYGQATGWPGPAGAAARGSGRQEVLHWDQALKRLRRASPQAAALLQLAAFLNSENIPVGLLALTGAVLPGELGASLRDPRVFHHALATLAQLGMVAHSGDRLAVPPLAQVAVGSALGGEGARSWAAYALRVLGLVLALPTRGGERPLWAEPSRLLPHGEAAARHALALGLRTPELPTVLSEIGVHLVRMRRPDLAVPYLERALQIAREMHGPKHREVVRALNHLALAHQLLGDEGRANHLHNEAMAIGRALDSRLLHDRPQHRNWP